MGTNSQWAGTLLKEQLLAQIKAAGGWVNAHTHLDRAGSITSETLHLAEAPLQEKWGLVDEMKRTSTTQDIYSRMARALEQQLAQGVRVIGSFIDVDEVVEDRALTAALKVKAEYQQDVTLVLINQVLKGVTKPGPRQWFDLAAQAVDIIGGLPASDGSKAGEQLHLLFETAKRLGKRVHVHVDQNNTAYESETAWLAKQTVLYGLQGRVTAIHSVSLSAQTKIDREACYDALLLAGVTVLVCPTAWIDARRSEELAPTHNAIAPVEELVRAGVPVAIGTDNIADIYKPFTDGDMWTELRFLLESCHFYDLDALTEIATRNGRLALGIE